MKKNNLKYITLVALVAVTMNSGIVGAKPNKFVGEYKKSEILSFGSSLSKAQEAELRTYFKAPTDVKATYVTTEVAVNQLGLPKSMIQTYKGGWYSSAYVKLTPQGSGVDVEASNLTMVTDDMLANALITSGVLNADVVASAPFKVSGESALAGILAGAEEIMGEELSKDNKETAQKEIETTLDLADEVGQKEASSIINDIKAEVIKDSPINNVQIENIVINVTNNYGVKLSNESKAQVVELMSDVNKLDIDYKDVKDSLDKASDKFREDMKALGKEIKESGIFERIGNWFEKMWNSFINIFKNNDDNGLNKDDDEQLDGANDSQDLVDESKDDDKASEKEESGELGETPIEPEKEQGSDKVDKEQSSSDDKVEQDKSKDDKDIIDDKVSSEEDSTLKTEDDNVEKNEDENKGSAESVDR